MALTNDADARRAAAPSAHATASRRDAGDRMRAGQRATVPGIYEQIELGLNYRMTDIQAALGTSQLDAARRRSSPAGANWRRATTASGETAADLPLAASRHQLSLASLCHPPAPQRDQAQPRQVFDASRAAGIGVNVHYIPVHTQPYYRRLGFKTGMFPEAESYYEDAITCRCFRG